MSNTTAPHQPGSVDLQRYSGKWYVIAEIPTRFDKSWNYITETYTPDKKGVMQTYTTYKKEATSPEKAVRSKGFPVKESHNLLWKVQFVWPFKADYLIEELADDYTYTVVGHPKKKFLYIMNRSGKMGELQYQQIVERMANKGYDMSKLHKIEQGF